MSCLLLLFSFFFFFKQKTAYEMRISDWSSDVCSSDLVRAGGLVGGDLQSVVPVPARTHGAGGVHHHLLRDRRGQPVVPGARRPLRRGQARVAGGGGGSGDRGAAADLRRRPARGDTRPAPAAAAGRQWRTLARGRRSAEAAGGEEWGRT